MRARFIGGPADGEWHDIKAPHHYVLATTVVVEDGAPRALKHTYRRIRLPDDISPVLALYTYDELSGVSALERLIEGYNGQAKT